MYGVPAVPLRGQPISFDMGVNGSEPINVGMLILHGNRNLCSWCAAFLCISNRC